MRLALPKGRLLSGTAALLDRANVGIDAYDGRSRSYCLESSRFPALSARVFQERDIPIQVAIGNYDLGICGQDWIQELTERYPSGDLVSIRELGYGRRELYVVVSKYTGVSSIEEINECFRRLRIVSEYQNLAESFAIKRRLRRFSVLPICGGGEVYPPESADVALIATTSTDELARYDLIPLARIMTSRACLIANGNSLAKADLGELVERLQPTDVEDEAEAYLPTVASVRGGKAATAEDTVRLAIPDGHLSKAAAPFLEEAGLNIKGYTGKGTTRRPKSNLPGLSIKVIRPQDMPSQVANNNFDLAITGDDWLLDHLYRFPSSPVKKMLTLGFGSVRVVAVVSRDLSVSNAGQLRDMLRTGQLPELRLASEYVNIADRYAFDNHLSRCKIIPTWGASEAFIPEDADLLIENTETGETLKRHRLKVIDTILESSACLIGNREVLSQPEKRGTIEHITDAMKKVCSSP